MIPRLLALLLLAAAPAVAGEAEITGSVAAEVRLFPYTNLH